MFGIEYGNDDCLFSDSKLVDALLQRLIGKLKRGFYFAPSLHAEISLVPSVDERACTEALFTRNLNKRSWFIDLQHIDIRVSACAPMPARVVPS